MRNLMATLLLSQGTPMMLAGDEFGRTQRGNNNAYCQDNDVSWMDWQLAETNAPMLAFTQRLLTLRRTTPLLHRSRYLHEGVDSELGIRELTWIGSDGNESHRENWNLDFPEAFGMLIDGEARPSGLPEKGNAETLLCVVNDHQTTVQFTLPHMQRDGQWKLIVSTEQFETAELTHAGGDVFSLARLCLMLWKYVVNA